MTPSITETQVFTALTSFLAAIMPAGVEIDQGQDNWVPPAKTADWVVFWPGTRQRLATTQARYDPASNTRIVTVSTQVGVQIDIHGVNSGDNTQTFLTMFRDRYGADFFAASDIAILECDDGVQLPYENGEGTYEKRWSIKALFQINPAISTPAQFTSTVTPNLHNVDADYPPTER